MRGVRKRIQENLDRLLLTLSDREVPHPLVLNAVEAIELLTAVGIVPERMQMPNPERVVFKFWRPPKATASLSCSPHELELLLETPETSHQLKLDHRKIRQVRDTMLSEGFSQDSGMGI